MKTLLAPLCLAAITASFAPPAAAQAVLTERNISLQLARVIADGAMDACKADKYDISVVILDRTGTVRLAMRADSASPHNFDLARRKAYTARTFRRSSADWAKRMSAEPELSGQKSLVEVIPLGGGLPINFGDETIGAIGVSGAPGQDKDEACAKAGIAKAANLLK